MCFQPHYCSVYLTRLATKCLGKTIFTENTLPDRIVQNISYTGLVTIPFTAPNLMKFAHNRFLFLFAQNYPSLFEWDINKYFLYVNIFSNN